MYTKYTARNIAAVLPLSLQTWVVGGISRGVLVKSQSHAYSPGLEDSMITND